MDRVGARALETGLNLGSKPDRWGLIMKRIGSALGGAIFTGLLLGLLAAPAGQALAADDTNPAGTTIGSYSGTAADDRFTNQGTVTGLIDMSQGGSDTVINQGTAGNSIYGGSSSTGNTVTNSGSVTGGIIGSRNTGVNSSGGYNTITNYGSVGGNLAGSGNGASGSSGGYNTVTNYGSVTGMIQGSGNGGSGSSGGYNTITNYGSVTSVIYGAYNTGVNSSGGYNTITNYSSVGTHIVGSDNVNTGSSGGYNTITNYGSVGGDMLGSKNWTVNAGGGNTITNYGTVGGSIYGSDNATANSSGGYNTINNSGTVSGHIYGSANSGDNSSSTGNTITNSGSVTGSIYGSQNTGAGSSGGDDTITNSGTVGGSIYGEDGNDTVIMQTGPGSVGGNIDGGTGTDTIVYSGGTWSAGDPKVINFENVQVNATHDLTLNGAWNLGSDAATVNGGALTVSGTLTAGSLNINTGTASISGTATVTGTTSVSGTLGVTNHGTLNTGLLNINSGGVANIDGVANVGGDTTVGGVLNLGSTGTLNTGGLNIGSGGNGNIHGVANVGGDTTVGGILNLYSGGELNTGNLWINSGGVTNAYGGVINATSWTTIHGVLNLHGGATLYTTTLSVYPGGAAYIGGLAKVSGDTDVAGYMEVMSGGQLSAGDLYIASSGTLLIEGKLYASITSNHGSLGVNGLLDSSRVVIGSTGTLWGSGQIIGQMANWGTVAPGNSIGTLSIKGGLTFEGGSLYVAELDSNGQSDLIAVDGRATINGGRILTALPQTLYADRFSWRILSATGGVSGGFEGVDGQPNSQTLSLHAVTYADHVNLEVWRAPLAGFGQGSGERETGTGLDRLVPLAAVSKDNLAGLINYMDWNYDRSQIQKTLQRLNPEIYAAYAGAELETAAIFDRALKRRVDEERQGRRLGLAEAPQGEGMLSAADEAAPGAEAPPPGPEARGWRFWGGGLGSWSNRSASDGHLGYRHSLGGVAAGLDSRVTEWLLVGLGVGATKSALDWGQPFWTGWLKGMHTALYAGVEAGGWHGQASLACSRFEADGQRDMDLADLLHAKAHGNFKAWSGLARFNGGYDFKRGSWLTGPFAGVAYALIKQDGFRESGAGFLNLNVDEQDDRSLASTLGWHVSHVFELGGVQVMPKASLDWQHEYEFSGRGLSAGFSGYENATFQVSGASPVADLAILHVGLTARVKDRVSAFVDLGMSLGQGYLANAVDFGLQFQF